MLNKDHQPLGLAEGTGDRVDALYHAIYITRWRSALQHSGLHINDEQCFHGDLAVTPFGVTTAVAQVIIPILPDKADDAPFSPIRTDPHLCYQR